MNRDILCRPFAPDQIRTRPGRNGQQLQYLETHSVIARLNEGCDRWDFDVVEHSVHDDEVIVLGRLTADGVVKTAFGGSSITIDSQGRVVSLADDLKAAASDSLKKCASLLGVGLELYGAPPARPAPSHNSGAANGNGGNGSGNGGNGADHGDRITAKQLAAIHAACRRLAVSRDDLHGLVSERFRKPKLEYLSKAEASAVLDHFNNVGVAAPH